MKKEDKYKVVEGLKEDLNNASTFYVTDISGLDAETTSQLRRAGFKGDLEMRVVKNTLLKKAMDQAEGEYEEMYSALKGNTCLIFSEAGSAPAKMIKDFRKKNDKPVIKAAYIDQEVYLGDENLEFLASIKSREELIGDIVALLQSPAKNVISGLQASAGNKVAGLVKALSERAE